MARCRCVGAPYQRTVRSEEFEFCSTRAYGHPFPWYIDDYPCLIGSPSVDLVYRGLNLATLALAAGAISGIVGLFWRMRKPSC